MNTQQIALITDSGTNTPEQAIAEHDIRVVSLRINFSDGASFTSLTIDEDELVRRFAHEIPSTSLPSPQEIEQALLQAKTDGYTSAVFVSIASALSGTHDTVKLIAAQHPEFPVCVIDSRNIGPGAGLVVQQVARAITNGVPFSELAALGEKIAEHTHIFFGMKTLDYLRKGGRISEAVYRVGSVLNIKPVMTCKPDGAYAIKKKVRGWENCLKQEVALAAQAAALYKQVRVAICCSRACKGYFEQLERALREAIPNMVECAFSGITPDLLVHTGPDLVGITLTEASYSFSGAYAAWSSS